MRDFRVDRIIEAKIVVNRPNTKNSSINSEPLDFTIAFKAPSRDVSERFNLDYANDEKTLQLSSYSQQWIERSVMASGEGVELVEPLNLRAAIAAKAQLILDRYKGA